VTTIFCLSLFHQSLLQCFVVLLIPFALFPPASGHGRCAGGCPIAGSWPAMPIRAVVEQQEVQGISCFDGPMLVDAVDLWPGMAECRARYIAVRTVPGMDRLPHLPAPHELLPPMSSTHGRLLLLPLRSIAHVVIRWTPSVDRKRTLCCCPAILTTEVRGGLPHSVPEIFGH
jgi:hypothetical protein